MCTVLFLCASIGMFVFISLDMLIGQYFFDSLLVYTLCLIVMALCLISQLHFLLDAHSTLSDWVRQLEDDGYFDEGVEK